MVVDHEFQSHPCLTIYNTNGEILEGSTWYELPDLVQSHSILVWKVDIGQANFDPTHVSKTVRGDHFRQWIPISTFSDHLSYYSGKVLEGSRCCELWNAGLNPHILHFGCEP